MPVLRAGVPRYLAIAQALAEDIRAGRLAPGAQLPPQRALAEALDVDLTTVTRAFGEARRQGLVEGTTRRGSFVRLPGTPRYAEPSLAAPPVVDLSMNMPPQPADGFLREAIRDGLDALLGSPAGLLTMHYQDNAGAPADRAAGARFLAERLDGPPVDRLVVMPGAQAALAAVLSVALAPGEVLATGAVAYPGVRAAAARCGLRLAGVALDEHGLIPAALEEVCARTGARAVYVVPTIDNPTTATLPLRRREELAALARRRDLAIVEDDAYGALPLATPPALAALAPDRTWHIATLSKCATPALRIAYAVAPDVAGALRLAADVRATSLMAPPLMAGLATRWIEDGTLAALTAAIRRESAARQAIAAQVLQGLSFAAHPEGHHLWLALPDGWRHGDVGADARRAGLSVVGSDAFAISEIPKAVRISLGAPSTRAALERGLTVLAAVLSGPPQAVAGIV
ncbi:aminotransferase-like domain-containing protein [Labrys wisconsinensis]|uniref:DNA-binding transcriptional MocR family regulator n=1 Tax=Labrys wisconsinensis TaxID=425677 RepID=A0ABU0IZY0_9HYPH|nr:PLP-dependent aminotransferase family protein [Labrys wisconsinensis]MDQ0467561.1 DNA-binding transcriptional MocR family regulator [Labrys wisconsinensis]